MMDGQLMSGAKSNLVYRYETAHIRLLAVLIICLALYSVD